MGGTRRSARQLTRCVDEGQGTMVVEGGRRPALWSEVMAEAWREALSDAEVRELLEMRDWRSWLSIAVDWGTIGIALTPVCRSPRRSRCRARACGGRSGAISRAGRAGSA